MDVGNLARRVYHVIRRNPPDPVIFGDRVLANQKSGRKLALFQVSLQVEVPVRPDAEGVKLDGLALILVRQLVEERLQLSARSTPVRPEIQDHNLAAQL